MDDKKDKTKQAKKHLYKAIGKKIKIERMTRKITSEELSEVVDLTSSHISLIENGKRGVNHLTLLRLSNTFNMLIDDFFPRQECILSPSEKADEERIQAKRDKILRLASHLDEAELEYVIRVIKEKYSKLSHLSDH